MSEKSIHERIKEKRDKLIDIHASMALHLAKNLTHTQRAKAQELQDRLEYRIFEYEEKLLDEKLGIYKQLLDTIR